MDRAQHVDARAQGRVRLAERHLQAGEVHDRAGRGVCDRALDHVEVRDVADDELHAVVGVVVEDVADASRVAADVEDDRRVAAIDEVLDGLLIWICSQESMWWQ